jgi:hypothetical protein
MLRSEEEINKEKLSRRNPPTTVGKKQLQHATGGGGKLQRRVLDPRGFQQ